jgi:hypothetical protein
MFNIKQNIFILFISFLIIFLPLQLFVFLDNTLLFSTFIKAEIIVILMCIPIIYYFRFSNSKYEAPLIPLFCIYFIISFIFPFGFFEEEIFNTYVKLCMNKDNIVPGGLSVLEVKFCNYKDDLFIDDIVNKLLITSISFLIGYLVSRKMFSSININLDFLEIEELKKIKILLIFLIIVILAKKFIYTGYIPIYTQSIIPLSYLMSGLCIYVLTRESSKLRFILLLPILIIIIKDIIDGYISFPVLLSFFSLTLYCVFKKKFPILFIFILFILMNIAHLFKYEHRKNLQSYQNSSNSEKFSMYKNSINSIISQNSFKNNIQNNLQRISHPLNSFAIIKKRTPAEIPFWNGYSYKLLVSKVIPRILWKDKPSDTIGNQVGKRYRVLNPSDNKTSWNLPVINEFYVNFGNTGLIIGTFLLSIFMYLISVIFKSSKNSNILTIFSIYISFKLFFLESHLSMVFGNLIQNIALLSIPIIVLNYKKFKNVKSIISIR